MIQLNEQDLKVTPFWQTGLRTHPKMMALNKNQKLNSK